MKPRVMLLTSLVAASAMVGCAGPHDEAKAEAYQRWYDARAGVLLSTGEDRFRTGDLEGAAGNAREALSMSPQNDQARMLLARVAIEKGSFNRALEYLGELAERTPEDDRVPYLQGVVHERLGRYEQALRSYEKARAIDPTNPGYVAAAAEVLVALDRADEALGLVETKLPVLEETAAVHVLAGDLAMLVGRPDRASGHYRHARRLDPTDSEILEKLARSLFFTGEYKRAAMYLTDLVGHEPYEQCVWAYMMLGDACLALGRNTQAKAAYQRVTELAGDQPKGWVNLATASLACNDLPRAVLSARRALRLDSGSAEAGAVLGYALLAQGKSQEARRILTEAAERHPNDPMLQCLLGRSYSAMGRTDEALTYYRATLKLDPDNLVAREMVSQLTQ